MRGVISSLSVPAMAVKIRLRWLKFKALESKAGSRSSAPSSMPSL